MLQKNKIILEKNKTALLIIDIQEKIYKVVRKHEKLIANTIKLIRGMKILNIPIYYTEQYPKGLGETVEELKIELNGDAIEKISFSCFGVKDLFDKFREKGIEQIVVCGIESHVCVLQTVLDLLGNGFQVNLAVNAISSRSKIDYKTAVRRLEKHGAEITTVESILFELMQVCTIPEFKKVSALIK